MYPKREILDKGTIKRSLKRIAHEILERNKGTDDLVIIGIRRKGVHLANRIFDNIFEIEGVKIPVGEVDITSHRDDIKEKQIDEIKDDSIIPCSLDGKKIILVDDVLYTGRTVRAAMDTLMDHGRPKSIQLAILIDRGHRELPIRPDYIGKNIPTSRRENVEVELVETGSEEDCVVIQFVGE